MKKFLISTIVAALVAALMGVFVACGDKDDNNGPSDKQLAQTAIATVQTLTDNMVGEETSSSYEVLGQSSANKKTYKVTWTVSSDFENLANYVSVGEMDAETKQVTINVKKAPTEITYTLKATVKVGKASASAEWTKKVPAGQAGEGQTEVSISFVGQATSGVRTVFTSTQQVWTQNGITLTNDKASSITNVSNGNSEYHVRLYQDSTVKIEYPAMVKLVFYSDNTYSYFDQLLTTLNAANLGTVTSNSEKATATLELAAPTNVIEFKATKQMRLTALDVIASDAGVSDADKVASAKAALDITNKNFIAAGTYDLTSEKNGATVTWALKEGTTSDYAEIEGGNKLKITLPAADTAEVKLTATIESNGVKDTKDFTLTLVQLNLENDGTVDHPYTPAEAWKVANLITAEDVYVKGVVVLPGEYKSDFDNFDNMYIADSYDADKTYSYDDYTNGEYGGIFYIFRPKPDGTYLKTTGLRKGDEVTFKGNFANHNGTSPQLANGTCVARVEAIRTDAEKIEDALGELKDTLTVNTTGANDLPKSTVTGVTFTWSTEDTTYTVTDNKLNIAKLPETPATVTLTVSAACGTATAQTKTVTVTVKAAAGYGTLQNPLSVTDALAIAADECKNSNDVTKQVVYATGVIKSVAAANNGFYNYTLRDAADATKTILVYTKSENVKDGVTAPAQNDVVVVSGYIKNYNGTIEFASNSGTYVYFESNTRGTSTITLGDHGGATVTELPETAVNGTEVTFTVAANEGKEITAVKLNGTAVTATNGTYKFTVAGNATVTVETKNEGAADAQTIYTLDASVKGTKNAYAGNEDITVDNITWNVEGNATTQPWRLGGQNITNQDRKITGKTAITGKVTEVVINFGAANITVNTVTFNVYKTDPTAAGAVVAYTKAVTYVADSSYTIIVPESEDWTNCYYQLVFNVTNGSGNKYVTVSNIVFKSNVTTATTTTNVVANELPEAILDEQ